MQKISNPAGNRDLRIDVLKIISMYAIVTIHAVSYGNALHMPITIFNRISVEVIFSFVYAMTNLFVIASAWFLVDYQSRPQKIKRMAIRVSLYATFLYCISVLSGWAQYNTTDLTRNLFALITNQYWFMTAYAIMYLLSPYLNIGMKAMTQRQQRNMLLILLAITSFIPSLFLIYKGGDLIDSNPGQNFIWFITLYATVFYIKKNHWKRVLHIPVKTLTIIGISCVCTLVAGREAFYLMSVKMGLGGYGSMRLFFNSSVLVLILSFTIFLLFMHIPQISGKHSWITKMSAATLGVYLISEHPSLRMPIWNIASKLYAAAPDFMVLSILGCALAVLTITLLVEMLIQHIEAKLFNRR